MTLLNLHLTPQSKTFISCVVRQGFRLRRTLHPGSHCGSHHSGSKRFLDLHFVDRETESYCPKPHSVNLAPTLKH